MRTGITVVTPTLPSRSELLDECAASVRAQLLAPFDHLAVIDHDGDGPALTRNRGIDAVKTEWVAFLDDDDLIDKGHLLLLMDEAERSEADLVWSWCRRLDSDVEIPRAAFFDRVALRQDNYIPITVLARADTVRGAGCFDPNDEHEDHGLWLRMLDREATFAVVPAVTWTYRGHK